MYASGMRNPYWKGKKFTTIHRERIISSNIGKKRSPFSEEHKRKIGEAGKGRFVSLETRKKLTDSRLGENNPRWVRDRSKLKRFNNDQKDRRSSAYVTWRRRVRSRDLCKCRIGNGDCSGRIEVHHILGYTEYPELRYEVNNGITLCHFHHPKTKQASVESISFFTNLITHEK